jgi:hypothetical protein
LILMVTDDRSAFIPLLDTPRTSRTGFLGDAFGLIPTVRRRVTRPWAGTDPIATQLTGRRATGWFTGHTLAGPARTGPLLRTEIATLT